MSVCRCGRSEDTYDAKNPLHACIYAPGTHDFQAPPGTAGVVAASFIGYGPTRTIDLRPFLYVYYRDWCGWFRVFTPKRGLSSGIGLWWAVRSKRTHIPFSERMGIRKPWRVGPLDVHVLRGNRAAY